MPFPTAAHLAAIAALVIGLGPTAAQEQDERARLRERAAQLTANLPPEAQPNEKLVYRTTDQGKPLSVWVYWPGGRKPQQPLPAICLSRRRLDDGNAGLLSRRGAPFRRARHDRAAARVPRQRKLGLEDPGLDEGRARRDALGEGPCRRAAHRSRAPVGGRRFSGRAAGRIARRGESGPSRRTGDRSAARSAGAVQPGPQLQLSGLRRCGLEEQSRRRRRGARGPRRLRSDEEPRGQLSAVHRVSRNRRRDGAVRRGQGVRGGGDAAGGRASWCRSKAPATPSIKVSATRRTSRSR